ncbi:translation elongation factor Tu [Sesbania bispinosa]|nr:translation elongation factor Tu [Sesbania bispinosa]
MAKSETWLAIADSQSRPSPRFGWRLPTPRVGGEFYGQVRDLVGDCRLPESVENFMAKSETWLAIADSQSRWKILWPSPRLGW